MSSKRHYIYVALTIICIPSTIGFSLDEFGFYKLVVAVDHRTVQNSVQNYTDIIKMGMQDFSDLLHYATNGKFSIDEVAILVPDHWNVEIDEIATSQFYEGADIKVSHTFSLPSVNNPNTCGFPGRDMQIPYGFFDNGDTGSYGRLGKALLAQFARLRFGIWEEHGYPGDTLFPYYRKSLIAGSEWEVNTCTDAPVTGIYKNIYDGTPCGPDPDDDLYPPPSECRFFPDIVQTAKSSLMSYHYLPTFEAFCNFETHDRSKPTPQNYYCRYKSAMEVIQDTPDWRSVTKENIARRVNFKVVKMSQKPLLYILLDSGLTQVPTTVLSEISSRLSTFIASPEMRNTVSALGKFPAENLGTAFTELIPWSHIRNHSQVFVEQFQTAFDHDGGFKNYAGALKDLLIRFKSRQHPAGAVILIVKTSPEPNTGDLTFESEVLLHLQLGNVKVFAIEVHGSSAQPGNALELVTQKSEGLHFSIERPSDLGPLFDDFLAQLKSTLQTQITRSKRYVLGMDGLVLNREAIAAQSNSKITQFEIFVMPMSGEFTSVRLLRGDDGNHDDIALTELKWDSGTNIPDSQKNFYYSSETITDTPLDDLLWQTFSVSCGPSDPCRARVVVLLQVEDINLIPQDIKLTVTTSAINNAVDFGVSNAGSPIGAAFAIYAKIEQDGIPLQSTPGLVVTATISNPGLPFSWVKELKDDANAAPDIAMNDGIFSGAFVPTDANVAIASYDGTYKIFVTVKYMAPGEVTSTPTVFFDDEYEYESIRVESSAGKLFPIDQEHIGCGSGYLGCSSKIPEENFLLSSDVDDLEFFNFGAFVPVPTKIMDLVITSVGNNLVNLQWSAPAVHTIPYATMQADWYEIRHQDNFENLLFDFDDAENMPQIRVPFPLMPGMLHNVTYDFGREADRYYAIRSVGVSTNVEVWSAMSVIVGVNIRGDVITTTTTTTTTVRPTTVTTLPPLTTPPGPSTTPEQDISTSTTTPRTTQARSTTTRPTTPLTSTLRTTTIPSPPATDDPTKHWYETTEGIITLSVFGGVILTLSTVGIGFYVWFTKYR